jgi:hypothetical protein
MKLALHYNTTLPSRSKYQLRNFVIGQHDTKPMQWRQILIEAQSLAYNIRMAELDIERKLIEIERLLATGDAIDAIEAEEKRLGIILTERTLEGAQLELDWLGEIAAEVGAHTLEDVENDQPNYWNLRLNRQAGLDRLSITEGVSASNLQSLLNAGLLKGLKMATLKNTTINDTGFITLPAGTFDQRPASPSAGMIRLNTEANITEYYNSSDVWVSTVDGSEVVLFSATGGTITEVGGYKIHTFTGSGTFSVTAGSKSVEYLIVAGGGASGGRASGGGGAGGVLVGNFTATPSTYSITVGGGGSGTNTLGGNGVNSSIDASVAVGGGGGRGDNNTTPASYSGASGGSGGGSGSVFNAANNVAGGAGTSGQGNNGGSAYGASSENTAGGGGGYSNAGGNGVFATAGSGGNGIEWPSGSGVYYAGGGGGGLQNSSRTPGGGGLGGGGAGSKTTTATAGGNNTGGGAGGSGSNLVTGANGGSGIVIIRYLI